MFLDLHNPILGLQCHEVHFVLYILCPSVHSGSTSCPKPQSTNCCPLCHHPFPLSPLLVLAVRAAFYKAHQENHKSDSMQLCTINALWGSFIHSIHFQAVQSNPTRALFTNILPLKCSVHGNTLKHSPKVLSSLLSSKLSHAQGSSIPSKSSANRTSQTRKNYLGMIVWAPIHLEPTVDTRSTSKHFCSTSHYSRCLYFLAS